MSDQSDLELTPQALEDLQTNDPVKQLPALNKIIYAAIQNKDVSYHSDVVLKHCLAPTTDRIVKLMAYSSLKYLKLTHLQWERVVTTSLSDLGSNDADIRMSAIRSFKLFPAKIASNFLETAALPTQLHEKSTVEVGDKAGVRVAAINTLLVLLLHRKFIRSLNSFQVVAWSAITDRLLRDPSQSVLTATLEGFNILFREVFLGPADPVAATDPSHQVLAKYLKVVMTKLTPNLDLVILRIHWAEQGKHNGLFPLACLLANLVETNATNTTPKLSFITSPTHYVYEVVEKELLPFMYSKDPALVFEAANSIGWLARRTLQYKPTWILTVCTAMMALLSRDVSRSVARKIISTVLSVVDLLPANFFLFTITRVLTLLSTLQLKSSFQRLAFVQQVVFIIINKCGSDEGFRSIKVISDLFAHPFIIGCLHHVDEDAFCEELFTCLLRGVQKSYQDHHVDPFAAADWKDTMVFLAIQCVKCLTWKCHLRSYTYESYIKFLDATCHVLFLTKTDRKQIEPLLTTVFESVSMLKHDPLVLRLLFVLAKYTTSNMRSLVENIHSFMISKFFSWLSSATETTTANAVKSPSSPSTSTGSMAIRQLGYKVDQLRKTNLSTTDTETALLILRVIGKHAAAWKSPTKLTVITAQIAEIAATRKGDIAAFERLTALAKLGVEEGIGAIHEYFPPIEYLDKTVVGRSPDDDFLMNYHKGLYKLKRAATRRNPVDSASPSIAEKLGMIASPRTSTSGQLENGVCISSPSDPFHVLAAYEVLGDLRVIVQLQLTNLTRFTVPKLVLQLNVSGRVDVSEMNQAVEIENIHSGQLIQELAVLRVSSFANNSVHARLHFLTDKPNNGLEMNCTPLRISMHKLVQPFMIDYTEFLKQWNRYSHTFQAKTFVPDISQVHEMAENLSTSYNCVSNFTWSADSFFNASYAALSMWDDVILFTVSGTRVEGDAAVIRFELRASSLHALVILDMNRQSWLSDLCGDHVRMLDEIAGGNEGTKTVFDITRPSLARREYNETVLLQNWQALEAPVL